MSSRALFSSVFFACLKIRICLPPRFLSFSTLLSCIQDHRSSCWVFCLFIYLFIRRAESFGLLHDSKMHYQISQDSLQAAVAACCPHPAGSYILQVPAGEQHKASQEDTIVHNFDTPTCKHSISPLQKNNKRENYNNIQ